MNVNKSGWVKSLLIIFKSLEFFLFLFFKFGGLVDAKKENYCLPNFKNWFSIEKQQRFICEL
jgi:hypothetical protein